MIFLADSFPVTLVNLAGEETTFTMASSDTRSGNWKHFEPLRSVLSHSGHEEKRKSNSIWNFERNILFRLAPAPIVSYLNVCMQFLSPHSRAIF